MSRNASVLEGNSVGLACKAAGLPLWTLIAAGIVGGALAGLPEAVAAGPSLTLVMDNGDPGTSSTGTWIASSSGQPYEEDALYSKRGTYTFTPQLPAGSYKVYLYWTLVRPIAAQARVTVQTVSGPQGFVLNQRVGGATWNLLGTFDLDASSFVLFKARNKYPVCADAAMFELVAPAPEPDPDLPPAAPTGFTAAGGVEFISLTWAANPEPDFAGYSIYRSTASGAGYTLLAGGLASTGFTDSSVTPGTKYYYVATASDEQGNESSFSSEVSAAAIAPAPAPAPSSVTLAWDAPVLCADGTQLDDLAGFKIYDGSQPGVYTSVTDVGSMTQFPLSSLPAGDYYMTVTAYDLAGNESGFSNEIFCRLE